MSEITELTSTASTVETERVSMESEQQVRPARPRRSGGLSKTMFNFWLDVCLLIVFLLLCWISAVLQFVFPAGANAEGWILWGADIVAWQNFQFATFCVFAGGIILHLMLHWSWICGVLNKQIFGRTVIKGDGTDTLIGVGLIAVVLHVLAIGVMVAWWCIEH